MAEFEIKVGETYRNQSHKVTISSVNHGRCAYAGDEGRSGHIDTYFFCQLYEPVPPAPGLVMTEDEWRDFDIFLSNLCGDCGTQRSRYEMYQELRAIRERTRKEYGQ